MRSIAIAAIFVLLACPAIAEQARGDMATLKVKKGDKFIDFEASNLGGMTFQTEKLTKGKIVILSFVIDPGFEQNEHARVLNLLAKNFPDDLVVIEIAVKKRATEQDLISYYNKMEAIFTPALDFEGKVFEAYGVTTTPMFIVANKEGEIEYILNTNLSAAIFYRTIEDMVKGTPENKRM